MGRGAWLVCEADLSYSCVFSKQQPSYLVCTPTGFVKLNFDVSLAVDGWIGLGAIARDSTWRVLFAATRRVRAHCFVEVAEAKAIKMVVCLEQRFGLQDVMVKSDCETVINRLSKHAIYLTDLDLVLHNIFLLVCIIPSLHSHMLNVTETI